MIKQHWQKSSASITQGPYVFAAFFKITYDSLQMVGPYILKDLLNFLSHCTTQDEAHESSECRLGAGMLFVVLILLSAGLQTSVLHQYFHRCFRTGMRLNASCISLVYCKSLKIPSAGGGWLLVVGERVWGDVGPILFACFENHLAFKEMTKNCLEIRNYLPWTFKKF